MRRPRHNRAFHIKRQMAATRRMKQRLASIVLCLVLMLCMPGCAWVGHVLKSRKKKDTTRVERATVPERVGEIVLLNEEANFVLIDLDTASVPDAGTALKVMRQ